MVRRRGWSGLVWINGVRSINHCATIDPHNVTVEKQQNGSFDRRPYVGRQIVAGTICDGENLTAVGI